MNLRTFCRIYAALAFASVVFWAFTGVGFWSPLQEDDGARGAVLVVLHYGGLMALIFAKA